MFEVDKVVVFEHLNISNLVYMKVMRKYRQNQIKSMLMNLNLNLFGKFSYLIVKRVELIVNIEMFLRNFYY
jgi:hypothetical protein